MGQFPDYKKVIPKTVSNRFQITRRPFIDASERSSIIASVSNNVVRMTFSDTHVSVVANAPAMGEFKEDVRLTRLDGQGSSRIAFNVRLVLDAVKNLECDDIIISFNDELSPCVIRPVSGDEFIYIIMPIRTSDYQSA